MAEERDDPRYQPSTQPLTSLFEGTTEVARLTTVWNRSRWLALLVWLAATFVIAAVALWLT